ncbi:MAG: aminoglycoside phosphotransferase family protein [Pyrinomonadaceae bacterium]
MSHYTDRLEKYLLSKGENDQFQAITADASIREYFRISWQGGTAVACVYPTAFDPTTHPFLDVTNLFLGSGLPVASVFDFDGHAGVIVQEDLGDRVLRNVMLEVEPRRQARLLDEAIALIAQIQRATNRARELNSVASKLTFDSEKLEWELQFFKTHYFETYLKQPLGSVEHAALCDEFHQLSAELSGFASVLCHRDFHAANLMLDNSDKMRIIDHQDARIGSPTYDLVSLLLDRITYLPSREWLSEKRRYFLDVRMRLGLPRLDEEQFAYEFRLQTIQRCLKAAGTFSYQSVNRGKTYFIPFIKPMFGISKRGAESLGRFPVIQEILGRELLSNP